MSYSFFKIDGTAYDVIIPEDGITQDGTILDNDNTQRTQSGNMIRDRVPGTFYNYAVKIRPKNGKVADFDTVYNLLLSDMDFHTLTLPHNQGVIEYQAYITSASRTLNKVKNGVYYWGEISARFIAKSPVLGGS